MRKPPDVEAMRGAVVASGEAVGVHGLASRADEAASAEGLAPGAGEALGGDDLVPSPAMALDEVKAEDEEKDEDDILHSARARVDCAVMARRCKGQGQKEALLERTVAKVLVEHGLLQAT